MADSIGESLQRLVHTYRSKVRERSLKAGISIPVSHIRSLKCIKHIENCSATDIASQLSLDKSQITRTLKDLVNDGYVEKRLNPTNHRSQWLYLTASGHELLTHLMTLEESTRHKMTNGVSQQDIQSFIAIAETMRRNLIVDSSQETKEKPSHKTHPEY